VELGRRITKTPTGLPFLVRARNKNDISCGWLESPALITVVLRPSIEPLPFPGAQGSGSACEREAGELNKLVRLFLASGAANRATRWCRARPVRATGSGRNARAAWRSSRAGEAGNILPRANDQPGEAEETPVTYSCRRWSAG
jgi:hypothetical protein